MPFQIFNIGSGKSINLSKLLNIIEKKLNKKIKSKKIEFQKGDVLKTQSDIKLVKKIFNYQSFTDTKKGINKVAITPFPISIIITPKAKILP